MTTSKKEVAFKPLILADDGILKVQRFVKGEVAQTATFYISDLEESPVWNHWKLQALFTTLSARVSQDAPEDKLERMTEHFQRWVNGEWSAPRKGGLRTIRVEVEALAQVKGVTVQAAQAAWTKLADEDKARLAAHPKMVEAIAAIQAAREAADELDLDDMIGE